MGGFPGLQQKQGLFVDPLKFSWPMPPKKVKRNDGFPLAVPWISTVNVDFRSLFKFNLMAFTVESMDIWDFLTKPSETDFSGPPCFPLPAKVSGDTPASGSVPKSGGGACTTLLNLGGH